MQATLNTAADKSRLIALAVEDITRRTLAGIPNRLARLICLASTRDYNTGQYLHEGLTSRFSDSIAGAALAKCHREIFQELVKRTLEELVQELEEYVAASGSSAADLVATWEKLQPYRVTVPLSADRLSIELFFSNIRAGLEVLRFRQRQGYLSLQSASQPQ